ncbi:MAG: alpha/beta fold hydrolase [Candidatus Gastranaerophilales bacterium]|nr:alpha/beta fold hydrolase [Candidatus Gastranaerophilales bacterium]
MIIRSVSNNYTIPRTFKNQNRLNVSPVCNNKAANADTVNFGGRSELYKFHPMNFFCNRLLRRSMIVSKNRYLSPIPELKGKIKNVVIKTPDNKELQSWDINPDKANKYVLFLHGMSQNVSHNQPLYAELNKAGYGVLALEYRGFGKNKKVKVTEELINKDVEAGLEYLKGQVPASNITVVGHSAGSSMAVDLASKNPDLGGVVLVSPINGFGRAANYVLSNTKKKYIPDPIKNFILNHPSAMDVFNRVFKTEDKIQRINAPTYIIHSSNDSMIPVTTAKFLSSKAKNLAGFYQIPKGGHKMESYKIEGITDVLSFQKPNISF